MDGVDSRIGARLQRYMSEQQLRSTLAELDTASQQPQSISFDHGTGDTFITWSQDHQTKIDHDGLVTGGGSA